MKIKSGGVVAVVAGYGEIGKPIRDLCRIGFQHVIVEDERFGPAEALPPGIESVEVLHIALPGSLPNFKEVVVGYYQKYKPLVVLIHSTTVPGTTDQLVECLGVDNVVHAQVQGKHGWMCSDMLRHLKFVATKSDAAFYKAVDVLCAMGHKRRKVLRLSCPLAGELSKLLATSLYAYLIVWTQEVERLSECSGVSFEELTSYLSLDTDDFEVRGKHPGVISGHCLMPNLKILQEAYPSALWDVMVASNEEKRRRTDGS